MIPRLLVLVLVLAFGVSITGVLVATQWNDRAAALREATPGEATTDSRAMAVEENGTPATSPQESSPSNAGAAPTSAWEATAEPEMASAAVQVADNDADQPPAFISNDPELRDTYQRARAIYADPTETEESRQRKIRVLQRNSGEEAVDACFALCPCHRSRGWNISDIRQPYARDGGFLRPREWITHGPGPRWRCDENTFRPFSRKHH